MILRHPIIASVLFFGLLNLHGQPTEAGVPMRIEVCAARLYALSYYHRIQSVSASHTDKAIEAIRRFRWRTLGYRENGVWNHYDLGRLSDTNTSETQRTRLGQRLRGLEVSYERAGELTSAGQRQIVAGLRIEGGFAIRKHFADIESALSDLSQVRGIGLANNFKVIGGVTGILVGGGLALANTVHPIFVLPAALGAMWAGQTILYFPLQFDYGSRRDFQFIKAQMEDQTDYPDEQRFFYSGKTYFVKPGFLELWQSRSLDASIVNNEFLHQQQVSRLEPDKNAHLVIFDRLLSFERQSDGGLMPVLTEFVRLTQDLPPAPEPKREQSALLAGILTPKVAPLLVTVPPRGRPR